MQITFVKKAQLKIISFQKEKNQWKGTEHSPQTLNLKYLSNLIHWIFDISNNVAVYGKSLGLKYQRFSTIICKLQDKGIRNTEFVATVQLLQRN